MSVLENKFAANMARRSDEELLEIIHYGKDEYQTEAYAAAQHELAKRNLSYERLEEAVASVEHKVYIEEAKANEPLSLGWKLLCFFFPAFLNIALAGTLKADGYHRKFTEAKRWTLYGWGFYLSLTLLIILLN